MGGFRGGLVGVGGSRVSSAAGKRFTQRLRQRGGSRQLAGGGGGVGLRGATPAGAERAITGRRRANAAGFPGPLFFGETGSVSKTTQTAFPVRRQIRSGPKRGIVTSPF